MKILKYLKFGNISVNVIFYTVLFILIFGYLLDYYFTGWHGVSIDSSNLEVIQYEVFLFYNFRIRHIMMIVLIKMILEYFYLLLTSRRDNNQ